MSAIPTTNEPIIEAAGDTEGSSSAVRALLSSWEGRIGIALGALMLLVIVLGPMLAPHDPTALAMGTPLSGPSVGFLFGTDNLGRDVFSRFLSGGGMILFVPLGAVAFGAIAGGLPGMLGAYVGGKTDLLISRLFDLLLTLPPLLIALAVIAGFGSSTPVLLFTVGIINAPQIGRVARGATLGVIATDYVLAAQARGERTITILLREVVPNILGPMVSDLSLRLTYAVIFVSTLNFLGLGAQPPSSDWGLTIATALGFIQAQPLATFAPAFGIAALSVSFNLIADALTRHFSHEPDGEKML